MVPAMSSFKPLEHTVVLEWLHSVAGRSGVRSAIPPHVAVPRDPIPDLSVDSRTIVPGDIFFAFPGDEGDGRDYIGDAIERGAAGVVYEDFNFTWPATYNLPHLAVSGLKSRSGVIARSYYGVPDRDMLTVAVTGTNGKTSCAYWLASALSQQARDASAAVVGTLGVGSFVNGKPGKFESTGYTTPDAVQLQRRLALLHNAHTAAVAFEASSIGLAEGRLNGMHVDIALFTNLTRDHLDYHGDMATYEAAKTALFDHPELQHGIVNLDDAMGLRLAQRLHVRGVPVLGYTLHGAVIDNIPTLAASAIRIGPTGTTFHVESPLGAAQIKSHLVGQFNVSNLLGVLGVLLANGMAWDTAIGIVAALKPVPGRMEQMGGHDAPLVVIDYAHTPDALEKTLLSLRDIADQRHGKLWCMVGCGGGRDSGKRPQMGRAAELADEVILTSDNPRNEEPMAIIEQIRAGMSVRSPQVLEDRAAAILWTVRHADKADVVLLAGKGHETYQEVNGRKLPFLDADHAALALAARATMMGGAA